MYTSVKEIMNMDSETPMTVKEIIDKVIPTREALLLISLYNRQAKAPGGLPSDRLAYTNNIRWITEEMNKRFVGRNWTEKLVLVVLVAMRKDSLLDNHWRKGKEESTPIQFPADDPLEGVHRGKMEFKEEEP